jgi:hypothetical protein
MSLVHVAIFTNQKVVPYIIPFVGIHVVVLERPDNGRTRTLCVAVLLGAPVMYNSVRRCRTESCGPSPWGSCAPFSSADYPRTCC